MIRCGRGPVAGDALAGLGDGGRDINSTRTTTLLASSRLRAPFPKPPRRPRLGRGVRRAECDTRFAPHLVDVIFSLCGPAYWPSSPVQSGTTTSPSNFPGSGRVADGRKGSSKHDRTAAGRQRAAQRAHVAIAGHGGRHGAKEWARGLRATGDQRFECVRTGLGEWPPACVDVHGSAMVLSPPACMSKTNAPPRPSARNGSRRRNGCNDSAASEGQAEAATSLTHRQYEPMLGSAIPFAVDVEPGITAIPGAGAPSSGRPVPHARGPCTPQRRLLPHRSHARSLVGGQRPLTQHHLLNHSLRQVPLRRPRGPPRTAASHLARTDRRLGAKFPFAVRLIPSRRSSRPAAASTPISPSQRGPWFGDRHDHQADLANAPVDPGETTTLGVCERAVRAADPLTHRALLTSSAPAAAGIRLEQPTPPPCGRGPSSQWAARSGLRSAARSPWHSTGYRLPQAGRGPLAGEADGLGGCSASAGNGLPFALRFRESSLPPEKRAGANPLRLAELRDRLPALLKSLQPLPPLRMFTRIFRSSHVPPPLTEQVPGVSGFQHPKLIIYTSSAI